jgi:outer membrane immunogenic protein
LTNNTFGRVECRYNDYGSKDLLGVDIEFNQNVVTVGVVSNSEIAQPERTA